METGEKYLSCIMLCEISFSIGRDCAQVAGEAKQEEARR